ncbi:hypothetical protein Q9233_004555, partial [Columba guinea]
APLPEAGMEARGAPSPHSEAVAHELRELSLQPGPQLPPLTERRNVLMGLQRHELHRCEESERTAKAAAARFLRV